MPKNNIRKIHTRTPAKLLSTMSRRYWPLTIEETLAWSDELWMHHGVYSNAIAKAVAYFMTEIDVRTKTSARTSDKEGNKVSVRNTYKDFFSSRFNLLEDATMFGIDLINWGNLYLYMYMPFTRMLRCKNPKCASSYNYLERSELFKLSSSGEFVGRCEECNHEGAFEVNDIKEDIQTSQPYLLRLDPVLCRIDKQCMSGKKRIYFEPYRWPWLMEGIMSNDSWHIAQVPYGMLKAARMGEQFEFNEGKCLHIGIPQPASISANLRGYGMPLFMGEFEDVMRIIMIDRVNESILANHSTAVRCLSPTPQASAGMDFNGGMVGGRDSNSSINLQGFAQAVQQMLLRHRNNPTGYHYVPFPLQYSQFGGDAKQMVMPDMMEYYEKRLLRSMAIPTEFYDTSLSTAGQIIGFQLFEQRWRFFTHAMDQALTWCAKRLGELMDWEDVVVKLSPTSISNNPQNSQLVLSLVQAGKLPDDMVYKLLGLDPNYVRQVIEDQQEKQAKDMELAQADMQKKQENRQWLMEPSAANVAMQQQQMAQQQQAAQQQAQGPQPGAMPPGAPPPQGGMPSPALMPAGGQPPPATIQQLAAKAQQKAQELFHADPDSKRVALAQLEATDQSFYYQVQGELARLTQQARTLGIRAAKQGQIPVQ